jgi:hypothetical protein
MGPWYVVCGTRSKRTTTREILAYVLGCGRTMFNMLPRSTAMRSGSVLPECEGRTALIFTVKEYRAWLAAGIRKNANFSGGLETD